MGRTCVCRLSLALQRVAERHGGSLRELSLAGNGIEELPRGVFDFFGGGGGGDDVDDEKSSAAACFRVLWRIDLSGNKGMKEVSGIGRSRTTPALREVVVDRGVKVVGLIGGGGGRGGGEGRRGSDDGEGEEGAVVVVEV